MMIILIAFILMVYEVYGMFRPQQRLDIVNALNDARQDDSIDNLIIDENNKDKSFTRRDVIIYMTLNFTYQIFLIVLVFTRVRLLALIIFIMGRLATVKYNRGEYTVRYIIIDAAVSIILLFFMIVMTVNHLLL